MKKIAAAGGGILNSARKLQQASADELEASALERLAEIERMGTGAVEIKSGYGLTVDAELKILRVIQKLRSQSRLIIRSTFLGAHALPLEYRQDRNGYIKLITDVMLPQIADEGLADYCDVFAKMDFSRRKKQTPYYRLPEI